MALTLALFPRADALALPERLTLAFPLSVAVTTTAALALDATPVGFQVPALAATLGGIAAGALALGLLRRVLEPAPAPFSVSGAGSRLWSRARAALVASTAAAAVLTVGLAVFLLTRDAQQESTELYALSAEGRAEGYPLAAREVDNGVILLGVASHEGERRAFTLELRLAGRLVRRIEVGTLTDGQVWERLLLLPAAERTTAQRLDVLLFRAGEGEPYRQVNLLLQPAP